MLTRTTPKTCLLALLSLSAPIQASDYTTILDASAYAVGANLGENLIVKEGCMIPAEDEATCEKAKYISAETGRVGSIELDLSLAEAFDVSMAIDMDAATGGGAGGETLLVHATDGSDLLFSYSGSSTGSDCRSTNVLDTGGSTSVYGTKYYYAGVSADSYRVGLFGGIVECYVNDVATTIYTGDVAQITLSNPTRLYNGVTVAGINDNDRLFDVKYRGEKLSSCEGTCQPSTPQPGTSVVISATNGPLISVKGGYIKLDTTSGAAPDPADCNTLEHDGRAVLDNVSGTLYLCTQSGWVAK